MSTLSVLKKEAAMRLQTRGRWLRLVGCGVISVLLLMLPFLLALNLSRLLSLFPFWTDGGWAVKVLPYLLMIPTFLLLTCPITVCVMRFAVAVGKDERRKIAQKSAYGRDLVLGLMILVWIFLPIGVMVASWMLPRLWLGDRPAWETVVSVVALLLSGFLAFLWFAFTGRMFFVPYEAAVGGSVCEVLVRARNRIASQKMLPRQFMDSFFGLLLLSVASIGVLLIFYTLPLMWMTYLFTADPTLQKAPRGSNE